MTDEALQIIGDIQHVRIEPGDVIVVTCPGVVSDELARRIQGTVAKLFTGHRCLILDSGIRMEVARRAPADGGANITMKHTNIAGQDDA